MARYAGTPHNVGPFLDMIAMSELGKPVIDQSDDGYNVLVGSTGLKVLTFPSYADHPNILNKSLDSTAAGRYQILHRWWVDYKAQLQLKDFSPISQDIVAIQQIRERGALGPLEDGDIEEAVIRCSNIWASLPGNSYGQHEQRMANLVMWFKNAGGVC